MASQPLPPIDWDSLKARFKQHQQRTNGVFQNWQIRVHRSLSWAKRAGTLPDDQPEAKYLLLWIALNAIYGQWDNDKNAPKPETPCRHWFVQTLVRRNESAIGDLLLRCRPLVKKILSDEYCSSVFWRDPFNEKSPGWANADANYLDRNFKDRAYSKLLDQVLERLFVLRGQLVHGASTGGSSLNRSSIRNGLELLTRLIPLVQHVVIEHGAHDDWPDLCYPPVQKRPRGDQ